MRVLMLPAGQDVQSNPYTHLLCEALRHTGTEVGSGSTVRSALQRCDVLHVHWPHNYASIPNLAAALARSTLLLVLGALTRLRGGKIVWTVHNLDSLRRNHTWLEALVMAAFTRMTNGLVFLSDTSEAALARARPKLTQRPSRRIPHGVYGDTYPAPKSKSQARLELGWAEPGLVLVCPGDIKPYKDPMPVVVAMAERGGDDLRLFLAGRCDPASYASAIGAAVTEAQAQGASVEWINRRLSDAELALVIDASDVVVLPYTRSWNSGLAVLALERRRRLVCSDMPGFRELAGELGPHWVHIATRGISAATLGELDRTPASSADEAALDRFVAARQWRTIAQQTRDFYEQLTSPQRPAGTSG